jgi:hypothetical protein
LPVARDRTKTVKIITRAVLDWDGNVLEEESFEYSGPLAQCKSGGSAPQPVDPYQQAQAQYGLATGTANYNAALNRTGSSNPLGSSGWSVTGTDGGSPGSSGYGPYPIPSNLGGGMYGFGGGMSTGSMGMGPSGPGAMLGGGTAYGMGGGGSGAPLYSQQTSLTPWANKMLSSPIDTSNVPGMPGGPNLTSALNSTRNAMYDQSMGYLRPQEALQSEQTQAQLENEGAMPGSAAYNTGERQLNQQQTFQNQQAADSAIGAGNQELSSLYGLGSQGLQNQLAVRNAPISEYEQLLGNGSGGQVSAATPDISGAFGQQYQGALAGYNANTATDNANTGAVSSLAALAAVYF